MNPHPFGAYSDLTTQQREKILDNDPELQKAMEEYGKAWQGGTPSSQLGEQQSNIASLIQKGAVALGFRQEDSK